LHCSAQVSCLYRDVPGRGSMAWFKHSNRTIREQVNGLIKL